MQLKKLLCVKRAHYKAPGSVSFESDVRNYGVTHAEVFLQNSSDKGVANLYTVLLVDDLGDLLSGPNTALFKLFYSVNCELKLALLKVLFGPDFVDVIRLLFDLGD